ncbi:hypothetical protein I203_102145 [Kwoniella mangroviensis CBS 8507]|uniref:uncharacterized protein n=1 Tax=Kwoniella mangroviensis CBS 8507 TaxID=1296122 RepID=UPI003060EB25
MSHQTASSSAHAQPHAPPNYILQTVFPILDVDGVANDAVEDEAQRVMLELAVRLARRIMFSPICRDLVIRSLSLDEAPVDDKASLPLPLDPRTIPINQSVEARFDQFKRSGEMTIVVDPYLDGYGGTDPEILPWIKIRIDLVRSAGKAWENRSSNPNSLNYILFFVSVVILHEMVHLMRMNDIGVTDNTPPSISNGEIYGELEEEDGTTGWYGEGGWALESSLLGGEFFVVMWPSGHPQQTYPDKVRRLVIQLTSPERWFYLPNTTISHIVEGRPGWQNLLPFAEPANAIPGINTEPRLRRHADPPPEYVYERDLSPLVIDHNPAVYCGHKGAAWRRGIDLMVLPTYPTLIITKVSQIIQFGRSAQLKWDDKIVLSTFGGQDLGDDGWKEVINGVESISGEKVFFIPSFFLPPEEILAKDDVDGAFHWNGAWPMNNHTTNLDSDKPFLNHEKPYMASVSPLFFTHYGTEGDWAFNKSVSLENVHVNIFLSSADGCFEYFIGTGYLLSLPPDQSPQFIEIISWNDFGESHYIGPLLGAQPGSERWTEGMDHEGFRVMIKYFIQKWKNQICRSPEKDSPSNDGNGDKGKLVVWYRTQSRDMSTAQDRVGKPDHSEWAQDLLNFFILLPTSQYSSKDTFTLHIQNGGHSHRPIPLEVGTVNLIPVPFYTGQVSFQVMKYGKQVIIEGKGMDVSQDGAGGGWNYNMWSGVFHAI